MLSHLGIKESTAEVLYTRGGLQDLDRRWSVFLKEQEMAGQY